MSNVPFSPICVAKGSHCVATGHEGKIGPDGLCRVARAWHKNARVCGLCQTASVHEATARRLNPIFVVGLIRGLVMPPRVKGMRPEIGRAYQAAIEMCYGYFCQGCVDKIAPFLNYDQGPGYIQFKARADGSPGSWNPMFVTPAEITTIYSAIGAGAVKLAERIARGGRDINFGENRRRAGVAEAECVVYRNMPAACLCGGWYDAREMPTLKRGEKQLFAFGPLCAEAVRRGGFKLEASFAEAMAELHRETPAQIDARLASEAERQRLEAEGTYIDPRGRRHVGNAAIAQALAAARERDLAKARELRTAGRHVPARLAQILAEEEGVIVVSTEEVSIERPRRGARKPKSPEQLSAEDQLARIAAKAAERNRKKTEAARRREEPHYGEMRVAKAGGGKKKTVAGEAGDKKKSRGRQKAA